MGKYASYRVGRIKWDNIQCLNSSMPKILEMLNSKSTSFIQPLFLSLSLTTSLLELSTQPKNCLLPSLPHWAWFFPFTSATEFCLSSCPPCSPFLGTFHLEVPLRTHVAFLSRPSCFWTTCMYWQAKVNQSRHGPAFMELTTAGETNPKQITTQYHPLGI